VERKVASGAVTLALQDSGGAGLPVVGLHGLTATRRYVLMGSRTLERAGHRVVLYDARGHGASTPGDAYGYRELAADLRAILDDLEIGRALLVGASMGAHTALRLVLDAPELVAALALITPAYDPAHHPANLDRWDALARGLRTDGVEGFLAAYDLDAVPSRWRDTVATVLRQRLAAHEHPAAVADALEAVPRSRPFESLDELRAVSAPTVVIGSRDAADPEHPLAIAEQYSRSLPRARLLVEEEGRSPLAWQGGALSRLLAELATKI
jgi:pimeloyl-ACP methyl ester carboxylesterase